MLKGLIKQKTKKSIFICQVTENYLKVVRCAIGKVSRRNFTALEVEIIIPGIEDKKLAERLNAIFKKLGYSNQPVVISLPRQSATCRYLKVPTQIPAEIEKIANLQSARYLPYPSDELITGYQVISTDKAGFAYINLVIVHKDIIERLIKIFRELNIKDLHVVLSSFGLCNLYNYFNPQDKKPVMVIDIDSGGIAEITIALGEKVLFSRSFKITKEKQGWESYFVEEINKTKTAYLKESSGKEPEKIILMAQGKDYQGAREVLKRNLTLPVEIISLKDKIPASEAFLNSFQNIDTSVSSLIGLGLEEIPESLDILPKEQKEESKKILLKKERLRLILFIFAVVVMFIFGLIKNMDNKSKYLQGLKIELNKIAKEAQPLEEMEKRLRLLERRSEKRLSSLELLSDLHQKTPSAIALTNFSYEEDNRVILRGQAQDLNSVFIFASELEKSPAFKKFNIAVKYATKRTTRSGEIIEFEIDCEIK